MPETRILYPEIKAKRPRKLGKNNVKMYPCLLATVLK